MNTNYTAIFWKKFLRYLLIGISAYVLLFLSTQEVKLNLVRAEDYIWDGTYEETYVYEPQYPTWDGTYEQTYVYEPFQPTPDGTYEETYVYEPPAPGYDIPSVDQPSFPSQVPSAPSQVPTPPQPAPVCQEDYYNQCIDCNLSESIYWNSCSGYQSLGTQFDAACEYLCEAPSPEAPLIELPTAPALCPRDAVVDTVQECLPGTTQLCTRNVHYREDCSTYLGGYYACVDSASCGFQQPAGPQGPQGPQGAPGRTVFVQLPPQQQQQPAQQPQQLVAQTVGVTTGNTVVTTGNTNVTTGSVSQTQSQTVNVPAQGAPIIIQQPGQTQTVTREVFVGGGVGNVGVGTTAQVLGVKELPRTGLPLLAWSALAFIPVGFKLKGLGSLKKDMEDNPHFIWEDRKFRTGS